jgi:hypothetical protein
LLAQACLISEVLTEKIVNARLLDLKKWLQRHRIWRNFLFFEYKCSVLAIRLGEIVRVEKSAVRAKTKMNDRGREQSIMNDLNVPDI